MLKILYNFFQHAIDLGPGTRPGVINLVLLLDSAELKDETTQVNDIWPKKGSKTGLNLAHVTVLILSNAKLPESPELQCLENCNTRIIAYLY